MAGGDAKQRFYQAYRMSDSFEASIFLRYVIHSLLFLLLLVGRRVSFRAITDHQLGSEQSYERCHEKVNLLRKQELKGLLEDGEEGD